jgi:hypothetical protein
LLDTVDNRAGVLPRRRALGTTEHLVIQGFQRNRPRQVVLHDQSASVSRQIDADPSAQPHERHCGQRCRVVPGEPRHGNPQIEIVVPADLGGLDVDAGR